MSGHSRPLSELTLAEADSYLEAVGLTRGRKIRMLVIKVLT